MSRKHKPAVPTEAHIRITLRLLNSPAYLALSWSARALFVDLRSKLKSTNNGNINATLSELRHRGWRSPSTLAKGLRELEAAGLIAKTRKTNGVEYGCKVCNLYRFTDLEVFELAKLFIDASKPTHDYLKFSALSDAKRAVAQASPPQKKMSLRKMERSATEKSSVASISATDSVVVPLLPSTKVGASRLGQVRPKVRIRAASKDLAAQ